MPDVIESVTSEQVTQFLYRYARVIDSGDGLGWVDMFTPDAEYSVTTYEQAKGDGLFLFVDRGIEALKERVAYVEGMWWATRRKNLHLINNVIIDGDDGLDLTVSSYFVLARASWDGRSNLHACGEYHDVIRRVDGGMKLHRHRVVIDAETLPSDLTDLL